MFALKEYYYFLPVFPCFLVELEIHLDAVATAEERNKLLFAVS
jgi:hypothetical protein